MRSIGVSPFLALSLLFVLVCKESPVEPKWQSSDLVGTWEGDYPVGTETVISANMIVGGGGTYNISTEKNDTTVFTSMGTWVVDGDSLRLFASQCGKVDTTASPPWTEYTCTDTIALFIDIENDEWDVAVRELGPAIESLGVPVALLGNTTITMRRQ